MFPFALHISLSLRSSIDRPHKSTHNHKPSPRTINNIHSARIVDANASHAVAHNGTILSMELDQFAAKLASMLVPCSPVVAEPC
jgi:hypothetical protein